MDFRVVAKNRSSRGRVRSPRSNDRRADRELIQIAIEDCATTMEEKSIVSPPAISGRRDVRAATIKRRLALHRTARGRGQRSLKFERDYQSRLIREARRRRRRGCVIKRDYCDPQPAHFPLDVIIRTTCLNVRAPPSSSVIYLSVSACAYPSSSPLTLPSSFSLRLLVRCALPRKYGGTYTYPIHRCYTPARRDGYATVTYRRAHLHVPIIRSAIFDPFIHARVPIYRDVGRAARRRKRDETRERGTARTRYVPSNVAILTGAAL